jgi:2-polyprenyl-6-methoxyphenol hydroxylase-like FAD-dependent oxidoreductase
MVALRRLGLDAAALEAGSVIERTRTFLFSGESFGSIDFAALTEKAGAPSICLHRATLQRLLLDAALCDDPRSVQTAENARVLRRMPLRLQLSSRTEQESTGMC